MLLVVYELWIIASGPVVGLALLAWWLGTRRMWDRLRHGPGPDPYRETKTRFGLSYLEAGGVEESVPRGRELTDERERTAAATLARERLAEYASRRDRLTVGGSLLLWLGHAFFAVYLVVLSLHVVRNEGGPLIQLLLYSVFGAFFAWSKRRALRKTVLLNSGPPEPTESSDVRTAQTS